VSIADHAADAVALLTISVCGAPRRRPLERRGGWRAAGTRPSRVRAPSTLLELKLFSVPSGEALFAQAEPAFRAYASGDHAGALAIFMSAVSGLEWTTCSAFLEASAPGAVAQAVRHADTSFGVELPALTEWPFDPEHRGTLPVAAPPPERSRNGLPDPSAPRP
jgi:hypothetical protein